MAEQVKTELCVQADQIKDGLLKCLFIAIRRDGGKMVFDADDLDLEKDWAEKLDIQTFINEFTKKTTVVLSINQ